MAAAQLNRSRRALLGAAVALPVLSVVEGPVPSVVDGPLLARPEAPEPLPRSADGPRAGEDQRWRRALAAFKAAEAELRAFERRTAGAAWEEQEAVEQGMDAHIDILYAALRRLLRIPAPDLRALATKIALSVDHEVGALTGGEACLALLKRDARRLAGGRGSGR